jgi:Zn-dependent peptidase ImmA (M78 family)
MIETSFLAPILSYEDVNGRVEQFLKNQHPKGTLPIPIEEIVDLNLRLNIFPFPGLQRDFDIDGFISNDLTTIYVDEVIYSKRPARYHFTLAHEVGHLVLHRDLIEAIHPKSVTDWQNFISNVDKETYDWLEWQAYSFAGLLLVPRNSLKKHFRRQLHALKDKIDLVKSKGLPPDSYREYLIDSIAHRLIRAYDVSIDVLTRRISKEIEKGLLVLP